MNSLYIIIPAYNEEENIEKVLEGWYPIIEKHHGDGNSRLVIIDDGSKDQTFSIVEKYAKTHPLTQILHKQNGGHGAALLYGYEYALKQGAEFVFQTDSDGQTLPEEFEMFWKEKDEYDMVIGHRNKREDGISRVFVTKILKYVIWICFGVSIRDANTPFRLMRGDTLQRYISLIPPEFNLSNVLISVIFVKQGCKVKFLPIIFRPRQGGVNSINLKKIIRIGKQAMVDFWRINKVLR